jgi:hypothetical protein
MISYERSQECPMLVRPTSGSGRAAAYDDWVGEELNADALRMQIIEKLFNPLSRRLERSVRVKGTSMW